MHTCRYVSSYSTPDEEVHSFWYHAAMSPVGLISGGAPPMRPCKSPLTLKGSSRATAPCERHSQSPADKCSAPACMSPAHPTSSTQSTGCLLQCEVPLLWHRAQLRACGWCLGGRQAQQGRAWLGRLWGGCAGRGLHEILQGVSRRCWGCCRDAVGRHGILLWRSCCRRRCCSATVTSDDCRLDQAPFGIRCACGPVKACTGAHSPRRCAHLDGRIYLISRHVNIAVYKVQQQAHMSFEQQSACMIIAVSLCRAKVTGSSHLAAHGCGHWHRAPPQHPAPQSPLRRWMRSAHAGRGSTGTGGPRSLQQCGPPGRHPAAKLADFAPRLCPHPAGGDDSVRPAYSPDKSCVPCQAALQVQCTSACQFLDQA